MPPREALAFPISPAAQNIGFAILPVSPRKRLDEEYLGFLSLVGSHVTTAIADARTLEEERKRAQALAEIDRAKTAFVSNVSREFRTPLTLMLGPLEELLGRQGVPAEDLALLSVTHRNGLRLQKLVNTLLDFSRIEAGPVQANYAPTDLSVFTSELASTFRAAVESAGLDLIVDCPPLPEAVYVDRDMWEKIVLNLLSNAFRYTFEGRIAVRIAARPGSNNRVSVLTVEDTGTGIPANELPHLFERFHRVEGARGRTQEGTSIGLALIAELVKLHGGAVEVSSAVGQGNSFTVSIHSVSRIFPPIVSAVRAALICRRCTGTRRHCMRNLTSRRPRAGYLRRQSALLRTGPGASSACWSSTAIATCANTCAGCSKPITR